MIEEILSFKRDEITALSGKDFPPRKRARFSFRQALAKKGLSIIAEIKRSSPSTGPLDADIDELHDAYQVAGVDALSILTDRFFGMTSGDLERLAANSDLPVLRKDFILSREQITEADSIGADAILLIATFLEREELKDLGDFAGSLGLDVLYEAHSENDLEKIPATAEIVGINNRDLSGGDFRTDRTLSEKLAARLPGGTLKVAESGFDAGGQVPAGYDAVLIGTGLIRAFKRSGSVSDLVTSLRRGYG